MAIAETEFQVDGHTYRAGRLHARDQFHVMRRIGGVLGAFGDSLGLAMQSASAVSVDALQPVLKALAALSDDDTDYVLTRLLSTVQRLQPGGGWARIQTAGGALMFDDIDDMGSMLKISIEVLKWNLSSFFSESPSSSTGPVTTPTRKERRASNGSRSRRAKAGS